jgi:hypothetical protein
MKSTHAWTGCGAFLGVAILFARADNADSSAPPPPAAAAPAAPASHPLVITPQGPWLQTFPPVRPDYVEAPAFNGPTGENPSGAADNTDSEHLDPADAERVAEQTYAANQEEKKQPDAGLQDQVAKQQAYAQDWMLRDYTARLKRQGLEKSDFTNPYLIPEPVDPAHPELAPDPLLDSPEKKKASATDPNASPFDDSSTLTPKKTLASAGFQPLLPALVSPPVAATSGTVGIEELSPADPNASLLSVPGDSTTDNSVDSLLDVPGLTAAAQNGVAPDNAIDFDKASPDNNRPRPTNGFLVPTAPTSDVAEFFKKQAEALAPPTVPGTVPAVLLPLKPRLIVDPEPAAKPAASGLRSHVDDPFDILKQ